jgi:hypothetical protein
MRRPDADTTLVTRLDRARQRLAEAHTVLATRPPTPRDLYAVVDGTIHVTTELAELVATVMRQAPAALADDHQGLLGEVLADLHATHGCLTTAPLTLAPARDDLSTVASAMAAHPADSDHEVFVMNDEKPARDLIDQHRPVRPDDTDDEPFLAGAQLDVPIEADFADVADQCRSAPVIDDEPWP